MQAEVNLIEPIECPKALRFLNSKLPKSKFIEQNKKTVGFTDPEMPHTTTFKIKSKKIRSEKMIPLQEDLR